jgi:hypothetical protein
MNTPVNGRFWENYAPFVLGEPVPWLHTAQELKRAADRLRDAPERMAGGTFMLLMGFALENLLTGALKGASPQVHSD